MTLPKCLKIYSKHFFRNPWACLWSAVLNMCATLSTSIDFWMEFSHNIFNFSTKNWSATDNKSNANSTFTVFWEMACTWFKKEENNNSSQDKKKKRKQCIGATQSLYPVRVQILQQCHKDIVLLVVQGNFMLCAFSHGSLQHSFQWVTYATKERKRKKRSTLKKNSTHSSNGPNHLHRHIKIQRCA